MEVLLSTSGIPASAARHAHRVDFAGGLAHRVTSARFVSSMAAFLAELLETGIGAQRVPDWIEF